MDIQPSNDPKELERRIAEREEEIRQLRLALDVLSPVDPSTGMLNRNGVIDAIQDALNWLVRRNDAFGILLVEMAGLDELRTASSDDHRRLHQHLEAVLAATLRRVDQVGHLDHKTFAAVLREFKVEGKAVLLGRLRVILETEAERAGAATVKPAFTLAVVKPGPFHQAGLLLEQVELLRGRATSDNPLIVEL